MKAERVQGIIWDLDGTLVDSFGIFEQIMADVVQASGRTMPTREQILTNYHGSLEDTVQRLLGLKSTEELDETINSFLVNQERHYAGDLETHLFPDAAGLARQAARLGIRQMVVTNRAHKNQGNASPRVIIAATTLADCIHEIRTRDEVDFCKPDKRAVGDWIERHQMTPDEVVVIGDQFVDAQLALNIGARTILIKRNGDIPHLDTLDNLNEVMVINSLDGIELAR